MRAGLPEPGRGSEARQPEEHAAQVQRAHENEDPNPRELVPCPHLRPVEREDGDHVEPRKDRGYEPRVHEEDLLREECQHQLVAWRAKGFDVVPLERLLEVDPKRFREISARLIRAQVMKKAEGGRYRCPLCDLRLESTAEECENCGARFA